MPCCVMRCDKSLSYPILCCAMAWPDWMVRHVQASIEAKIHAHVTVHDAHSVHWLSASQLAIAIRSGVQPGVQLASCRCSTLQTSNLLHHQAINALLHLAPGQLQRGAAGQTKHAMVPACVCVDAEFGLCACSVWQGLLLLYPAACQTPAFCPPLPCPLQTTRLKAHAEGSTKQSSMSTAAL